VVRDVAATVGLHELRPDAFRIDEHVRGTGPDPERVDVGVLDE